MIPLSFPSNVYGVWALMPDGVHVRGRLVDDGHREGRDGVLVFAARVWAGLGGNI